MSKENVGIAIFDTHGEAENAVKELQRSGFDMKKLSIVGKDYYTEEQVVGKSAKGSILLRRFFCSVNDACTMAAKGGIYPLPCFVST
jgi:hypothetical protein